MALHVHLGGGVALVGEFPCSAWLTLYGTTLLGAGSTPVDDAQTRS